MFRRDILMDEAGENSGGGGSGSGNNNGGAAAFDMNAFFSRFTSVLDEKLSALKPPAPPAPAGEGEGDKGGDKNKGGDNSSPRWKQLQDELAAEKKARLDSEKKAEEKDRHGIVRGLLSDFTFSNDTAREDAFRAFSSEIKRGENEGLYGPENESAKEYIARRLESDRAYWLKSKDVGGSGAVNGGSRGGNQTVELNNIKPGMDANELQRVRAEISRVALAALRGQ